MDHSGDVFGGLFQFGQIVLGSDQLLGQFVLLGSSDVVGDDPVGTLGGPDHPVPPDLLNLAPGGVNKFGGSRPLLVEIGGQVPPDGLDQLRWQLPGPPVLRHQFFELVNVEVGQVAAVAAMPSEAEEVHIRTAVAVEVADG